MKVAIASGRGRGSFAPLRWISLSLLVVGGLWLCLPRSAWGVTAEISAPDLAPGFVQLTVVSGLVRPVDLALLPSGDMLVVEKGAGTGVDGLSNVRLIRQGVLQPEPVITLSTNVEGDSGLLAITIDPDFVDNGFFYVWYAPGETAVDWTGTRTNRLSRLTLDLATGRADPASEAVMMDGLAWNGIHNGGSLLFDDDYNLLISMGDAGGPLGSGNVAQSLTSRSGKVLRIRPRLDGGYDIPADNPFVDEHAADASIRPEIYALGLRNPFRMVKRASDGAVFVTDVGQVTWEEINLLEMGANYGWPVREGPCPLGVRENCSPAPAVYTEPILTYAHPETKGGGITGLAYYAGDDFPEAYRNRLFYADYNGRWLGMADPEHGTATHALFGENMGVVTDIEAGAGGLYLLDIWTGRLNYIYYDEDANQPPAVSLAATPIQGRAPLSVTLSAAGTRDPDDLVLTYTWDLGRGGEPTVTRSQAITQVYPADGVYTVTLTVRDLRGAAAEPVHLPIAVYSGEWPELWQTNLTEPGRALYHGGDEFRFEAVRSAGLDGLDPATPYQWTVYQHHNEHVHVILADVVTTTLLVTLPMEGHADELDIWYEVELRMMTDQGQRLVFTRELQPALTTVQVDAWPGRPSLPFQFDGQVLPYDREVEVIAGQSYLLEAPPTLLHAGQVGEFAYWMAAESWPAAVSPAFAPILIPERRASVRPGATPQVYVAHYRFVRDANQVLIPYVTGPAEKGPVEPPAAPPDPPGSRVEVAE